MGKKYFVFKLNIQPDTIINFRSSGDYDYLIKQLIPDVLDHVIGIKKRVE